MPSLGNVGSPLSVLSLCSGIGGLDIGVCRAFGGRVVALCERDPYCASVLLERMEKEALDPAPVWIGDLHDLDARPLAGYADIVCAGIPCQPWAQCGLHQGTADDRHLGHELIRIVGEVDPLFVCVENVSGFVTWDGLGGLLGALADLGFDAEWTSLLASHPLVGAPHHRERLFLLAYSHRARLEGQRRPAPSCPDERYPWPSGPKGRWDALPPSLWPAAQRGVRGDAAGVSDRVERLRSLGNSCSPQQAEIAFRHLLGRVA